MNAIILAAGLGTRLRPLTNDRPKCMVEVNGVPMIERQIAFLQEAGITDITLVSGYRADRLEYLKDKYHVNIVSNECYETCNNIYSLYKVLDLLGNTWIIEGDIFMERNYFTTHIKQSTYFAKWHNHYENEWGLITDSIGILQDIKIGNGQGYVMSGVSYWNNNDSQIIKDEILRLIRADNYAELFWDNAILNIHTRLSINVLSAPNIHEIDTVEDLHKLESEL